MGMNRFLVVLSAIAGALLAGASARAGGPSPTGFTYQGQLRLNGQVVNDLCDFEFRVFADPNSPVEVGPTLRFDGLGGNPPPINVVDGLFTVKLDFGIGVFDEMSRYLEISVRCPSGVGAYTTLSPRQGVTPTPFAVNASGLLLPFIAFQAAADTFLIYNTAGDTPVQAIAALRGELPNAGANPFSAAVHGEAPGAIGVRGVTTFNGIGGEFFAQLDGQALVARSIGTGDALTAKATGTGKAAVFEVANAASAANGVEVMVDGGGDALSVRQTGTGKAAVLDIFNPASAANVIEAATDGGGDVISAVTTGTGRAGRFAVQNPASNAATLSIDQFGTGLAGDFNILNAASTAPVLDVFHAGLGQAAQFTTGGGLPLSTAAVAADNFTPTNSAGEFTLHDPNNADPALVATTPGNGTFGDAVGVLGEATDPVGFSVGVHGRSAGNFGKGVRGESTSPNGNTIGVWGTAASTSGTGVSGSVTAATGTTTGVSGFVTSTSGRGVRGWANALTGETYGVWGESASEDGTGVYGKATRLFGPTVGVVGESASSSGIGVRGVATRTSGDAYGVWGESASADGIGVYGLGARNDVNAHTLGVLGEIVNGSGAAVAGIAPSNSSPSRAFLGVNGSNRGVSHDSDPNDAAAAVEGLATADNGVTRGVWGITHSKNGIGVEGLATITTFDGTVPTSIGVRGVSRQPLGTGVRAEATATTGGNVGVHAIARGNTGTAVFADANSTSGSTTGVHALASSPDGIGVQAIGGQYGVDAGGDTAGVRGSSASVGVRGQSTTGVGVEGAGPIGVRSQGTLDVVGNALISGNLTVMGTVTKGGGSFKIDHPLDPESKFLYHSFVESPDMMNIYNGNVVTDAGGYATVELPEWFEALNRDFRYQLTVIDDENSDSFVLAKVVDRVRDNRFTIRTSEPRVEVSWQVTGIRQDAWANANRIPVEAPKAGAERGRYLYPEAWGLPKESGVGYEQKRRECEAIESIEPRREHPHNDGTPQASALVPPPEGVQP